LRLTKLMQGAGLATRDLPSDPDITGLTEDSRRVKPGFLFVAVSGSRSDGANYLHEAVQRGAVAIIAEPGKTLHSEAGAPIINVEQTRRYYSLLAAQFYRTQPSGIAAVTGTNGKTSVVSFLRQIWSLSGFRAASVGTLGVEAPGVTGADWSQQILNLTTPDPVFLHRALDHLAFNKVQRVAIEASSHGLDQYRIDGVQVTQAGFTNLTRDHVDYHGSMALYLKAKLRLFDEVMKPGGVAVLNRDCSVFDEMAQLCKHRGHRIIDYGFSLDGRLTGGIDLLQVKQSDTGLVLILHFEDEVHKVNIPVMGQFQAENIMCSIGLAVADGVPFGNVIGALPKLVPARGRMELVSHSKNGASIFIDYAHTPDALKHALGSLRGCCEGDLVLVFGCGGDRDQGKRVEMGSIACELADKVVVTDDNPRTEIPAAIRQQIMRACPGALEVADRGDAIKVAINMLRRGDLLLIAGKGHENYQIMGAEKLDYSDLAIVQGAITRDAH
jgi:UDP-N-acetylmuramoyl-L-alanyl-D-glutamate--2,6-diaminopimelate ligase